MSGRLPFVKMHGAGNDFVVLDGRGDPLPPLEPLARQLCDRHLGVGADQVLVVRPSRAADFRMEIYNADGSAAEMCANGIRAFFKYLRDRGLARADRIEVETLGGVVRPRWAGADRVEVEMGRPVFEPAKIPVRPEAFGAAASAEGPILDAPLDVDGERLRLSCVSMGNPHAVAIVDDPEAAPVERLGPRVERHPAFPNRTNVEFIAPLSRGRIRQRTWERGTGETLACGSGACAAAVVSMRRGLVDRRVVVELRGGELEIVWERDDAPVFLTGPAAEVFTGEFAL